MQAWEPSLVGRPLPKAQSGDRGKVVRMTNLNGRESEKQKEIPRLLGASSCSIHLLNHARHCSILGGHRPQSPSLTIVTGTRPIHQASLLPPTMMTAVLCRLSIRSCKPTGSLSIRTTSPQKPQKSQTASAT